MWLLQASVLIVLGLITKQDLQWRLVSWPLFLFLALLGGIIHWQQSFYSVFFIEISINIVLVALLTMSLFLYARFKMKRSIWQVIGLGDILMFIALGLCLPTLPFIVTFISSLIFSLIIHLIGSNNLHHNTIPLAGYMSLFYFVLFLADWLFLDNSLFFFN